MYVACCIVFAGEPVGESVWYLLPSSSLQVVVVVDMTQSFLVMQQCRYLTFKAILIELCNFAEAKCARLEN